MFNIFNRGFTNGIMFGDFGKVSFPMTGLIMRGGQDELLKGKTPIRKVI